MILYLFYYYVFVGEMMNNIWADHTMDDLVTLRNDSSRMAVDPDGIVFKSKPRRRAGRRQNRRQNKKKNQASQDK